MGWQVIIAPSAQTDLRTSLKLSASGTGHADFLTFQVQLDLPELTRPFRRSFDRPQLLPARVEFRGIFLRGGEVGGVS
jgi:hypothetical protein